MHGPRFTVTNIVRVPRERARQLRATFDLQIAGIGEIRLCRLLEEGPNGRRYVLGPSLKDEYRGWFQTVFFDDDAALEILRTFDATIEASTIAIALGEGTEA